MGRKPASKDRLDPQLKKAIAEYFMETGASCSKIAVMFGVSEAKVNVIAGAALKEFRNKKK